MDTSGRKSHYHQQSGFLPQDPPPHPPTPHHEIYPGMRLRTVGLIKAILSISQPEWDQIMKGVNKDTVGSNTELQKQFSLPSCPCWTLIFSWLCGTRANSRKNHHVWLMRSYRLSVHRATDTKKDPEIWAVRCT